MTQEGEGEGTPGHRSGWVRLELEAQARRRIAPCMTTRRFSLGQGLTCGRTIHKAPSPGRRAEVQRSRRRSGPRLGERNVRGTPPQSRTSPRTLGSTGRPAKPRRTAYDHAPRPLHREDSLHAVP
eukprot:scaffold93707_cov32-Tisochrysis_lutea.AAC.3